jgi:hypothetical protein
MAWTLDARTIIATVTTEKTARARTDKVPMCSHLRHFIEFFVRRVRPTLLRPHRSEPLTLWINYYGGPMEYSSYTRGLQAVSREFHPLLRLSLLNYRRAFITAFYKGEISYEGSYDDFLRRLGVFLNVSGPVMAAHYDRHEVQPENEATQLQLSEGVNFAADPEVSQLLTQVSEHLAATTDPNERRVEAEPQQRLRRTIVDDAEWRAKLIEGGLCPLTTMVGRGGSSPLAPEALATASSAAAAAAAATTTVRDNNNADS